MARARRVVSMAHGALGNPLTCVDMTVPVSGGIRSARYASRDGEARGFDTFFSHARCAATDIGSRRRAERHLPRRSCAEMIVPSQVTAEVRLVRASTTGDIPLHSHTVGLSLWASTHCSRWLRITVTRPRDTVRQSCCTVESLERHADRTSLTACLHPPRLRTGLNIGSDSDPRKWDYRDLRPLNFLRPGRSWTRSTFGTLAAGRL
jgi:hypothetical protein